MKTRSSFCVGAALLGSWIAMAGCAQLKHQPVANFEKVDGIPYYLGSWYLLVYTDGKGGLKSDLLYMMDQRRRMEARPRAWFASLDSLLKMDGGMLTRSEATIDTTAVPKAIIKAAEKAASLLVANDPSGGTGIPAPSIFRVQIEPPAAPDGPTLVTFVGELSDFTVEVF